MDARRGARIEWVGRDLVARPARAGAVLHLKCHPHLSPRGALCCALSGYEDLLLPKDPQLLHKVLGPGPLRVGPSPLPHRQHE
eukprot:8890489-Lingulodinium_polyedra.AAC.1